MDPMDPNDSNFVTADIIADTASLIAGHFNMFKKMTIARVALASSTVCALAALAVLSVMVKTAR